MKTGEISRGRFLAALLGVAMVVLAVRFAQPVAKVFAAHPLRARRHRPLRAVKPRIKPQSSPTPVLVELFTSDGCSSCPTADSLLARLQSEQPVPAADVLALEEHVDYWDTPEWRDRFASQQLSARQSAYIERLLLHAEYTPQMIIDGTKELEGTDVVHALHAIAQAAGTPKLELKLSPIGLDGTHLAGRVSVSRSARGDRWAYVYAAVVESAVSTQVLGGENGGQTLHHASVVREMRQIGSVAQAKVKPLKFSLNVPEDAASESLRVVVFVQRAGQGAVLGAVQASPVVSPAPLSITAMAAPAVE